MLFKGAMASVLSGKMGGVVASHNSGGSYLRRLVVPVQSNTAQQLAVKSIFSSMVAAWNALTVAQRLAWEVYAQNTPITNRIGDSINISGRNWFIACNTPRLQAGTLTQVSAGPTTMGLAQLTLPVPTITQSTTTLSLAFTNTDLWATEVGGALLVFASRPQNAAKNFFAGPYRFCGKVLGAVSPPTSPAALTLPFTAGPTGSKVGLRYLSVRADGRISPTFRSLATV